MGTVSNARQRVHQAVREDIVEAARRQLAVDGASALSLRAVARELEMASSAVYRYFASREELITALIVDAYTEMGQAAEHAAEQPGSSIKRFGAVCRTVRAWSLDHPYEYALLYGSPVPGYEAPGSTLGPASRVPLAVQSVVVDAFRNGEMSSPADAPSVSRALAAQIKVVSQTMPEVPLWVAARATQVWALLFGQISFEVFGRLNDMVARPEVLFEFTISTMAGMIGLTPKSGRNN
jgi:AcrR family transcriptional regulator